MSKIEKFVIHGLWNKKNVELKFKDNRLILVGENGSGKTTILRIIYAFLASRIDILKQENFQYIELYIYGQDIKKLKSDIENLNYIDSIDSDMLMKEMPISIRRRMSRIYNDSDTIDYDDFVELLDDNFNERDKNQILNYVYRNKYNISEDINFTIIYFPTYRLVEKEVSIFNNYYSTLSSNSLYNPRLKIDYKLNSFNMDNKKSKEIIENGMHGLEVYIESYLESIKLKADDSATKLNYQSFKGILKREYKNILDYNINEDDIEKVFNSVNSDVLSEDEKKSIKDQLKNIIDNKDKKNEDYDNIVLYFYEKLYLRYKEIKDEEKYILEYFNLCNKYLNNKELVYKEDEFRYEIILKDDYTNKITLSDLSAGEKQIVLMFAYLYLLNTNDERIMFIIDEPELSLSLPWQKDFLVDISNSPRCEGLISATHSPFIFENDLDVYVEYLGNFINLLRD